MKTYRFGTVGDRIVAVKKASGEHVVTIRTVTANVLSFHLKGKFICILNVFDCFSVYVCFYR